MGGECEVCLKAKAAIKRPKTGSKVCKECFYYLFEEEVHNTIVSEDLFHEGDKVAIAASGGKDSTVLAHVLTTLNKRYKYGLDLFLLSVDEGITGYRDDSLETVKRNKDEYQVPLQIVSYKELYGWTMDAIVKEIGMKNNCTFCGVFRRQALDRGAMMCRADKVVTGHNADDVAETVLMNILRGDIARLGRCAEIITGKDSKLPRCKPFKYAYEKEIVLYAFYKRLDYFSTECVYSPNAYRGFAREFLKDLEAVRPRAILDIIHAAEQLVVDVGKATPPEAHACVRCGYMTSQELCKACELLSGLNSGTARLSLRNQKQQRKGRKKLEIAAETKEGGKGCGGEGAGAGCGGLCECGATGEAEGAKPELSQLRAATAALVAGLTADGKEDEEEAKPSAATGKVWGSLGGQTDRSVSWERKGEADVVRVTATATASSAATKK